MAKAEPPSDADAVGGGGADEFIECLFEFLPSCWAVLWVPGWSCHDEYYLLQ